MMERVRWERWNWRWTKISQSTPAPLNPPVLPKPKYGQAQLAACTAPPPNPDACRMCINHKVVSTWMACISQGGQASQSRAATSSSSAPPEQLTLIICPPAQDQLHGQINDVKRQLAWCDCCTAALLQDHMQVMEEDLANCQWTMATLTHEMEMLRANLHGTQLAQTAGPPPTDEDLLNLFRPSTSNTSTGEAEDSIAAELCRLVLTATLSIPNIETNQPVEEGNMDAPVEVERSSVLGGNDEDGSSIGCVENH
ncbi:hypothetical protein EDC04DRAFT_2608335 [Pisolithus marmoratus]|nr:hypothetical protein EDC04DRAFT_2608335 [Pisolithus marmoratus]